jgi:hypothetical protein
VAPGGGWQDNKAGEAYTNFNKLPLKGLGCRVDGS